MSIETGPKEVSWDGLVMIHDMAERAKRERGRRPAIDLTPDFKPRITVYAEHGVSFLDVMEAISAAKFDHLAEEVKNGLLDEPD